MEFKTTADGHTITIEIAGELDATTVDELRPKLDAIARERPQSVHIDLTRLRMVDSSGVGAIVSLFKRIRAYGAKFAVSGVNGQPLSIFKILRLDKAFNAAPLPSYRSKATSVGALESSETAFRI